MWADGYAGFAPAVDPATMRKAVSEFRGAWASAGRAGSPYTMTSTFFALGEGAESRLRSGAMTYARYHGTYREGLDEVTVDSPDRMRRALDDVQEAGYDSVMLIPTTDDIGELDRLQQVVEMWADGS